MLTIHSSQMDRLSRAALEEWLLAHVLRFFPRHCAALGREGVRGAVQRAVALARKLGFTGDYEIVNYVDLTFMFGLEFHRRPGYEWAARILNLGPTVDPRERMERLYQEALAYLKALSVAGNPGGR